MRLLGTMHHRPVRLTSDASGHIVMNPPAPECEICEHDRYMVARYIDRHQSHVLICEGCHAEYDLTEEL